MAGARRRRVRRWATRLGLALAALIVLLAGAVVIGAHTARGRELARAQLEAGLRERFPGGARIGALEGSPFGELVLRDVMIADVTGAPMIRAGAVRFRIGLLALLRRHARVDGLVAEDVELHLGRGRELAPAAGPRGERGWSAELRGARVRRAHVVLDAGFERLDLDAIDAAGTVRISDTGAIDARAIARARLRQRGADVAAEVHVRATEDGIELPYASARIGDALVAGGGIRIGPGGGAPLALAGALVVHAPRAAALAPALGPGPLAAVIEAAPAARGTRVTARGTVAGAPFAAGVALDLAARRGRGLVAAGALELAALGGWGAAAGALVFDATLPARGAPSRWPRGAALAHATLADAPGRPPVRVAAAITVEAGAAAFAGPVSVEDDARAHAFAGLVAPGTTASAAGELRARGDAIELARGVLTARSREPPAGVLVGARLAGAVDARLAVTGALAPALALDVAGTVRGRGVRAGALAVDSLRLALDMRDLPRRPRGRAELAAAGVAYDALALRDLAVTARPRPDGRLAIAAGARAATWRAAADAIVAPGRRTVVELGRQRVWGADGRAWAGQGGRVAVDAERIEVRGVALAGAAGRIALAGEAHHAGRRAGDFAGTLDVTALALAAASPALHGTVDAHVAIARGRGVLTGVAELTGARLAADRGVGPFDAFARIAARGETVTVDATARSPHGAAELAATLDVGVAGLGAWRALRRDAIREARVRLDRVDLARAAQVAGLRGAYTGTLAGDLRVTPGALGGALAVRGARLPVFGDDPVTADLELAQRPAGPVEAAAHVHIAHVGRAGVAAAVAVPDRPFDPDAWRRRGAAAIERASVRVDDVVIDPGLLDRLRVATPLRGRARLTAELSGAARTASVALAVRELRGDPLARPLDVTLGAAIDDAAARARIEVRGARGVLVEAAGEAAVTLAALQADPRALLAAPLRATATLPPIAAVDLLGVFGRGALAGGTVRGSAVLAGTVGRPTGRARVVGDALTAAGARGVKVVEHVTADAAWDGAAGVVEIAGTARGGSLRLVARGRLDALDRATATLAARDFELAPLLAFAPGPAGGAAGRVDGSLAITGFRAASAQLAGRLRVRDARAPIAPTVGTLRRARLDLEVRGRAATFELAGRIGRGRVKASGSASLDGGARAGGSARIELRGVSPIGVVEPVIDADVDVRLSPGRETWIADVIVTRGKVDVPSKRGEQLKPVGAPPDMVFATGVPGRRPRRPRPERFPVVAHVQLRGIEIESEELRATIHGRLTATVDDGELALAGTISADRGDLDLFGRRYRVERAELRFDGSLDPLLDLRISHDFAEVTTFTEARGRLSDPQLTLGSDPGTYSQAQLLGFLLGAEPRGTLSGGPRDAPTAGASLVANRLSSYVRAVLPFDIDVLRYEAATFDSSARVTIGTWVTRKVFVAYNHRLAARLDENSAEGEVEVWLSRRLVVEGVVGDRGYNGVDLLWRKRF